MRLFRASRHPRATFDPLDASGSVARDGWRFNDRHSEILYAGEVQALAILEVAARPGWHTLRTLTIAVIDVPDGTVVDLADLGLELPPNWNARPAAPHTRHVGGNFLTAVDRAAAAGKQICGVRVPSVISTTDHNVLLDPRQKARFVVSSWAYVPFD